MMEDIKKKIYINNSKKYYNIRSLKKINTIESIMHKIEYGPPQIVFFSEEVDLKKKIWRPS